MNRENQNDINDNILKESQIEKDKNNSIFFPINDREQIDSRMNSNAMNLQNSACKNFKNDIKSESANVFM